ncbi:hypothetical protein EPO04_03795 [Patescibacteria group bacterium]|nr:MAG: hypothetical protein EPO04_03795 [Patescibacteria group bacterium]
MSDFNWLIAAGLLVGYAVVDGLYAYYTLAVVKRQAMAAASTSFIMHFILAAGVFSYTQNFLYTIPLAIGSFVGTYLVTKYIRQ